MSTEKSTKKLSFSYWEQWLNQLNGPKDLPFGALQLAKEGHSLNESTVLGWHVLHVAAGRNQWEMVGPLIRMGADLEARASSGATPLMQACVSRSEECAKELIRLGANVHHLNHHGDGCLQAAAGSAMVEVCETFMEQSVKVITIEDSVNATWWSCAAQGRFWKSEESSSAVHQIKRQEMLNFCLKEGVQVDDPIRLRNGRLGTKLHKLCQATGLGEINDGLIEQLLKNGANPNARTQDGKTALHMLCDKSRWMSWESKAAKVLLEAGADPYLEDALGHSPMAFEWNQSLEIKAVLQEWFCLEEVKELEQALEGMIVTEPDSRKSRAL